MSTDAANRKALEEYKAEWGRRAVASGMINPAFYPTYQSILTKSIPTITDKATFDKAANDLAQAIKVWYVNAKYRGNLGQLATEIDAKKPKYDDTVPAPTPAPAPAPPKAATPAPTPPPGAECLSNGVLTLAMNNYQTTCANTPQVNEVRNKFFTTEPNATINFQKEFETLQALSQADIQDIEGLLTGSGKGEIFLQLIEKLQVQKDKLTTTLNEKRSKADATNRQFLDEKASTGEVTKSKVNVLQDYILAAFTISWIFLIVVVIIYITRTSETPIKSLISASVLGIIVSAVLYTWVMAIA